MNTASISLAQSPPLSVPARFFATGPVFGMLTGLLLIAAGASMISDRWTPAVLAATHLLTLGYMGMIMLGALMQVFPVVIGHAFRNPLGVSRLVHASLTIGVVLLAAGFLAGEEAIMLAALAAILAALLIFLGAAARTLSGVDVWGDTARTIALALAAFAVMTGLGAWLALGHTPHVPLERSWTDFHAAWGLAGWVPLLLMGVAFQVVPMFQVTPPYPPVVRRVLPVLLFAMLLTGMLAHGLGLPDWLVTLSQAVAALVLIGFAVTTLMLQRRRRRSRPDVTVSYWRVGLACLILGVLAWFSGLLLPAIRSDPRLPLLLGVLIIPGFSLSVINGMLYKIVPFLVWLHLAMSPTASGRPPAGSAPGVKNVIPAARPWFQLRIHALSVLLMAAGVLGVPGLLQAGGAAFTVACALIGLDIVSALRLYRSRSAGARQAAEPPRRSTAAPDK